VFTIKTQTYLLSLPQQKVIYSIEIALTYMIHVQPVFRPPSGKHESYM